MYKNAKDFFYVFNCNKSAEKRFSSTRRPIKNIFTFKKTEHFSIHCSTFAVINSTFLHNVSQSMAMLSPLGNHVSHEYRNEQEAGHLRLENSFLTLNSFSACLFCSYSFHRIRAAATSSISIQTQIHIKWIFLSPIFSLFRSRPIEFIGSFILFRCITVCAAAQQRVH